MSNLAPYKLKEGVSLIGLQMPMRTVIKEAGYIWRDLGQILVITAGTEKPDAHGAGSYHPFGYALDLRVRYFEDGGQEAYNQLREKFKHAPYTIIFHKGHHIHIHYNA